MAIQDYSYTGIPSRVVTPEVQLMTEHCLRVLTVTSNIFYVYFVTNGKWKVVYKEMTGVHTVYLTFPVQKGKFQAMFEGSLDSAIAEVTLKEGNCLDLRELF